MSARPGLCALELPVLEALQADAYVLFIGEDERPLSGLGGVLDWRQGASLSRHLLSGTLTGAKGESVLTTTLSGLAAPRLFAFGLGRAGDGESFERRVAEAFLTLEKAGMKRVVFGLPEKPELPVAAKILADAVSRSALGEAWIAGPLEALSRALPSAPKR